MRVNFEYDMHLQYENRALKARIRELESGAAYVRMQEECEKRCREMEREVRKLKTELENAVRQLRQNREHWFQVYGDMEKEHKKVVERKQGEIRRLQKLCEKTAIAYEQMHEKYMGPVSYTHLDVYKRQFSTSSGMLCLVQSPPLFFVWQI